MDNAKKAHDRKINAVMTEGIYNFELLDEKFDNLDEVIILKTDEVMTHAEEKINEIVMTKEEFDRLLDEMAE